VSPYVEEVRLEVSVVVVGCFSTVNLTTNEWINWPLKPVIVRVRVPKRVVGVVVTLRTVPAPVEGLGERSPDAPEGRPFNVKPTGSANPPERVMLMVKVGTLPAHHRLGCRNSGQREVRRHVDDECHRGRVS